MSKVAQSITSIAARSASDYDTICSSVIGYVTSYLGSIGSMKIVSITDTHFAEENIDGHRKSTIADILLQRAVHRVNKMIKPDVTLFLGDVNQGANPTLHEIMRGILDQINSPTIVLPGNHDGLVDKFYEVFDRPPDTVDIDGVRFLPFCDKRYPHGNAERTEKDLQRMMAARNGHDGPIVSLQHTSLLPPGATDCQFQVFNADEIMTAMRHAGINLSISGHFHQGYDHVPSGDLSFVVTPALCDPPFYFHEIDLDRDNLSVTRHQLAMPEELELIDTHVHTPFAYCSRNMDIPRVIEIGKELSLKGIVFAEHTGQLYFDEPTFWEAQFLIDGMESKEGWNNRMPEYLSAVESFADSFVSVGLEVDTDYRARPVIFEEDRKRLHFVVGGIHWLSELQKSEPNVDKASDEFLFMMKGICSSGVHTFAHPLRVFRRAGVKVPKEIIQPTVKLLRKYDVACEINCHNNKPSLPLIKECLKAGVKFTFGGDVHTMYEVGEFHPNIELLRQCNFNGNLNDILLDVDSILRRAAAT